MIKKKILLTIALTGLAFILIFSIQYARGTINFDNYKILLLVSTIMWFSGIMITASRGGG